MSIEKALLIGEIENGTVIDHIPERAVLKIPQIFKLYDRETGRISIGDKYPSTRLKGLKGVIKIEGVFLTQEEIHLLALIAPGATISFIRDGKVFGDKIRKIEPPEVLEGIVNCLNPNCISRFIPKYHTRPEALPKIRFLGGDKFRCFYCEKNYSREDLSKPDNFYEVK